MYSDGGNDGTIKPHAETGELAPDGNARGYRSGFGFNPRLPSLVDEDGSDGPDLRIRADRH